MEQYIYYKISMGYTNRLCGGPCGIIKGQGTGKVCSLYQGFVLSRFFSSHFTIAGVKKIVCYTEDFVVYRGSTVLNQDIDMLLFFLWFKLYFLLFRDIRSNVMYDNEFETKENKILYLPTFSEI